VEHQAVAVVQALERCHHLAGLGPDGRRQRSCIRRVTVIDDAAEQPWWTRASSEAAAVTG